MAALILVVVIALLCVAVAVQRLRARRWTLEAMDAWPRQAETFHDIWLQTTPPRSSMRAYRDRRTGALSVDPRSQHALFRTDAGDVVRLDAVTDMRAGRRGSDLVNTWIELHAELDGAPSVVYLNDGGWFGWRPLLTGSNRELARSLASLLPRSHLEAPGSL
jgi:hypothetical protein